jgi:hypothetical protein
LACLANGLANVVEGISQALQLARVLGDVHVPLHHVPELGFEINRPVELVVTELLLDASPDGVRRGLGRRTMARTSLATEL